mmetsp:Transcript_17576/g.35711  ORF Transcript_17576/g.35711 Transcript_17576/m.35711 type:complete len:168 (+) Transcript_17576:1-504(+)
MKRKFRTRSTFDIKYMQEIKFILYGNLGDFNNFNDEDKKVIKQAADQFYESEMLVSGLPFYSRLPVIEKSHHHHGVQLHNDEIAQRDVDKILNERWTGMEVEAVKLLLWTAMEIPDAFFYVIARGLVKILFVATRKVDFLSFQVRPSFASKFSDFAWVDLKQEAKRS